MRSEGQQGAITLPKAVTISVDKMPPWNTAQIIRSRLFAVCCFLCLLYHMGFLGGNMAKHLLHSQDWSVNRNNNKVILEIATFVASYGLSILFKAVEMVGRDVAGSGLFALCCVNGTYDAAIWVRKVNCHPF